MQVVGGPNDSIIFVTLGVGVCFGEIALLGTGGMNRRTASIKVCGDGGGCGGDGTCEDDGGGDCGVRIVVLRTVVVGMVVMGMVLVGIMVVGKVVMEMLVAMMVAFKM